MRKWFLGGATVVGVGLVSSIGFGVVSGARENQQEPKVATSRIVKVVVYPNSALVTREVDVPAGAGIADVVVSGLPPQAVSSSLYSEGSNGLRVLSTRFRTRQVFEDAREEVRKAEEEKYKLELTVEKLQADIKASTDNISMIGKLENFTNVTTVSATEKGGLNGDTVITMAKYVMEQRTEKVKELVALQQQLKNTQIQMEFVKRKLGELSSGSSRMERDAVIVVDRENAGGHVRLNYLVNHVRWAPQYKLRAGKATENVQIDYLASLVQQTGEDWTAVDMTLSTAQPMLNATPPDLRKLEITVIPRASVPTIANAPGGRAGGFDGKGGGGAAIVNPTNSIEFYAKGAQNLRQQAGDFANANNWKDAEKALNAAAAYEQTRDLSKSKEDLALESRRSRGPSEDDVPSVTYHLQHKLSVPSRNDEQVVEVAKLSLTPKYYYKAVPVLNLHVYRQADLVNNSDIVLLPGEATMYQGTDFVGRMRMPLVAVGEEFTAGFGVDPQLQIHRLMMDRTRTMSGGNQVLKYEYRILVNSYKTQKVQLQVWDRLPVSHETETTGVNLLKATPELSKDGDLPARAASQEPPTLGPGNRASDERRKSARHQLRVPAGVGQADGHQCAAEQIDAGGEW